MFLTHKSSLSYAFYPQGQPYYCTFAVFFNLHAQSCPALGNSLDCSLPGYSVHGIFSAKILKQVAISFSRGSSQPRNPICVSCIASGFFTAEPQGTPFFFLFFFSYAHVKKLKLQKAIKCEFTLSLHDLLFRGQKCELVLGLSRKFSYTIIRWYP